jgi:hypothetical protein
MTLKVRKPTGVVPWPLVLIEGPEKCGKTWMSLQFSSCDKVGQMYVLDLGEGTTDEYRDIPGADFLVIDHDGSWRDIIDQVNEVRAVAQAAVDEGKPPVVLVVDTMTDEWTMLSDWANQRAKKTDTNAKKLKANPDAEISVSMNFWNDATNRHRKLMTLLLTFPGIVLITARGKEVAAVDDNGKPTGEKTYKVEGHKTLAFDATVWVRLSRESAPVIVGARSVRHGIRPGIDKPKPKPDFNLEWLIFEILGCDPGNAQTRDIKHLDASELTPEERGEDPAAAALLEAKQAVWELAQALGIKDVNQLAADYGKYNGGKAIGEATVEDLGQYAIELSQALETKRQEQAAADQATHEVANAA